MVRWAVSYCLINCSQSLYLIPFITVYFGFPTLFPSSKKFLFEFDLGIEHWSIWNPGDNNDATFIIRKVYTFRDFTSTYTLWRFSLGSYLVWKPTLETMSKRCWDDHITKMRILSLVYCSSWWVFFNRLFKNKIDCIHFSSRFGFIENSTLELIVTKQLIVRLFDSPIIICNVH